MSELPALREALRETAERHYGRRRRRPLWRPSRGLAMVGCLVVAVLAIVAVPLSNRDAPTPADEVAVTPTPVPSSTPPAATLEEARKELAKVYGVFRHARRSDDRPPFKGPASVSTAIEGDMGNARRVGPAGGHQAWLIPATINGVTGLCHQVRLDLKRDTGGGGCGRFSPTKAVTRPSWSKTFMRSGGPVYFLPLPDGIDQVTIRLKAGDPITEPVVDNGVIIQVRGLIDISWRDSSGTRHSTRATP